MINEITCNNNNAIEMSRGELLQWLNQTLRLSYSKIEQMGTGAAYCKLLDLMYPGAVPMGKVNWKAKFDYEYVANFKVLQQSFTKLNILRHIDVEKLVKCKYQDNLEFLQWFKKIFDNSGAQQKDIAELPKPDRTEKQNKLPPADTSISNISIDSASKAMQAKEDSLTNFSLGMDSRLEQAKMFRIFKSPQKHERLDDNLLALLEDSKNEEKLFYLGKLKEIERLLDEWEGERPCGELISCVRAIILAVPEVQWDAEQQEKEQAEGTIEN